MFNFAKYMIASGMILLLISHGIIQFGMFELVQTNLRSESTERINRGIPQHQQVIFRFGVEDYRDKSSQINWKDKDEFRLDGKMYDIIKKETSGDSVYLYCIIDREESDLYSILDKLIEDDSENSDKGNRINNYFSHFYSYSPQNNFHKIYQSENRYFGRIVISLLEGDLSLGTPPPRA